MKRSVKTNPNYHNEKPIQDSVLHIVKENVQKAESLFDIIDRVTNNPNAKYAYDSYTLDDKLLNHKKNNIIMNLRKEKEEKSRNIARNL